MAVEKLSHWGATGWLAGLLLLLPATGLAKDQIWAKAELAKDDPYVQEAVVYRVRVFSKGNLRSIQLSPPSGTGASLEELEGPVTSTTTIRGRRYVVNEFRYVLTPMQAGPLEISPAHLTVTTTTENRPAYGRMNPWQQRAPQNGGRTVKVSTKPMRLNAQPPVRGVQPWLPLEYLDVESHWAENQQAAVGQPLTLTVTIKARGAKGNQLPGVASLLDTPDFKVYPERPQTDWKFGPDGKVLWGRRVETFTLVPTREGNLTFASIPVRWWDVLAHRDALAKTPGRVIAVGSDGSAGGGSSPGGPSFLSRLLNEHAFLNYALPLGGGLLAAFGVGLWIGLGSPGARRMGRLGGTGAQGLREAGVAAGRSLTAVTYRVIPARLGQGLAAVGRRARALSAGLLGRAIGTLPVRAKTWWCVRCVGQERDAAALCQVLRRFACDHLSMKANAPLPSIAERIAEERPRADAAPLQDLFRELDDAAYGGQRLELRRWKRGFRRRFRRIFRSPRREDLEGHDVGLPKLNP